MDLDTYLGPMWKDGALQNTISYWETGDDLPDVYSGIMKMTHPPRPPPTEYLTLSQVRVPRQRPKILRSLFVHVYAEIQRTFSAQ